MTLPTNYSWSLTGKPVSVPYEAPQGRRINALGGYFSHGPLSGKLVTELYVGLPKSKAKNPRKSPAQMALSHGLTFEESKRVGPITSERFVDFLWELSGRPQSARRNWRRKRPLVVVLDNYSVHSSQLVHEATEALNAANVFLFYLPSYSPELSDIEPIWNSVKHYTMMRRSYETAGELLHAVDTSLMQKAAELQDIKSKSDNLLRHST